MACYSFRFKVELEGKSLSFGEVCLHQHPPALALAEGIYRESHGEDGFSEQRLASLLFLLYTGAIRKEAPSPAGLTYHQISRLERFVDRHPHPSIKELAKELDLTHDYFSRQFKKSLGRSPKRWLVEKRMQKAAFLLQHGRQDMAGLARELGYEDPNFFSRQFSKEYGLPPSEFRQA